MTQTTKKMNFSKKFLTFLYVSVISKFNFFLVSLFVSLSRVFTHTHTNKHTHTCKQTTHTVRQDNITREGREIGKKRRRKKKSEIYKHNHTHTERKTQTHKYAHTHTHSHTHKHMQTNKQATHAVREDNIRREGRDRKK